jgi:hypothetical protein
MDWTTVADAFMRLMGIASALFLAYGAFLVIRFVAGNRARAARQAAGQTRSIKSAAPWPTPMHMVHKP